MGKRKRTWSHIYQSSPKRSRKEEFTNFRQFIHDAPDALRQIKGTKRVCSHGDLLAILQSCTQETSIKMVDCSSDLTKVESTLYERNNLESGEIIWIINILASAINDQPEQVCSIIERSNFFERSDVSGMVLKSAATDCYKLKSWTKDFITLLVSVPRQYTNKNMFFKTIFSILSKTECINDSLVIEEIIKAFRNLQVKGKDIQGDSQTQLPAPGCIEDILCDLITWTIFPTIEMVVNDKCPPRWPRDLETLRIPYVNSAHYLMEQFSMFLEDFIGPLRKGIHNFIKYAQSKKPQGRFRDKDIWIYKRVCLLGNKCIEGSGVCLEVQFDTSTMKKMRWGASKRLQYGNVVCLTLDDSSELIYALVANRDLKQLTEGRTFLKILEENPDIVHKFRRMHTSRLVMIESKSFFEAYNHTLKSLQNLAMKMLGGNENIPFAKYFVNLNSEVLEPLYMQSKNNEEITLDFSCLVHTEQNLPTFYKKVPILEVEKWPTRQEMCLNEDQYEALKKCLTKEVGILQGPPGTGKTWMGVRIVEFLINNLRNTFDSAERRPILLLSHTNHALDHFFEKLLELKSIKRILAQMGYRKPFVRVGQRCGNEQVMEYSINAHRKQYRQNTKYWTGMLKEMRNSLKSVDYIDTLLAFLQEGIVSFDFLKSEEIILQKHIFSLTHNPSFVSNNNGILATWLGVNENGVRYNHGNETQAVDRTEMELDNMFLQETERKFLDDSDKNEVAKRNILKAISPLFVLSRLHSMPNEYHMLQNRKRSAFAYIRNMLRNQNDFMPDETARRVENVWDLKYKDRWRLYKFWIRNITFKLKNRRKHIVELFNERDKAVQIERFEQDLKILKSCYMVGMTTTGAATNMKLLRQIQPRIVVVEEAAQVHEQHIIGCLTKELQHLILIGDHQQLRPAMNNYDLKRSHKTDVSLMERLVMNKFPFHCLTCQHRMRPEISRMLTPAIYPTLQNHSSVLSYQNIKGMKHNLFFMNHQKLENQTKFSTSYTNDFEADMIAQLYKYLILQGYSNADITILSAYNDQVKKIRRKVAEISQRIRVSEKRLQQRVQITTVDNFQGEENRIILQSLVRSNKKCILGHLSDSLRICVSLSRAKEGMYVIGNFEMLNNGSDGLWKKMIKKANESGMFGESLSLVCQNHPETITEVSTPQDFEKVPDGGCIEPCATKLQCGDDCDRRCHGDESIHNLPCQRPCLKICDSGHLCPKKCYKECGDCMTKVMKTHRTCEHEVEIPCCRDPSLTSCRFDCARELQCGHPCTLLCDQSCDDCICKVLINIVPTQCHHKTKIECYKKDSYICQKKCTEILPCGHRCKGDCHQCSNGRLHIPCKEMCEKTLVCGHRCRDFCWNPCPPCTENCDRDCIHKTNRFDHLCKNVCESCEEMCDWKCYDECENRFACSAKCFEDCRRPPCDKRCKKSLECSVNHRCIGLCGENCPKKCKRCDKKELSNCVESKNIDKSLFIELIKCGHIFEVETMDTHMNLHSKDHSCRDKQVALKTCPRCSTPIKRSGRYKVVINQAYQDLMNVNRKCEEMANNLFSYEHLSLNAQNMVQHPIHLDVIAGPLAAEQWRHKHVKTVLQTFHKKANPRKKELLIISDRSFILEIENSFDVLSKWILHHSDICFTQKELEQLTDELERLLMYADLILLKFKEKRILSQSELDIIESNLSKLRCPDVTTFNRGDIVSAQSVFDELRKMHGISCQWMLEEDRRMSFNDVVCGKHGNWYKCTKAGHIYLSEAAGTVDDPRCPDCISSQDDPPTEEEMEVT